MKPITYKQVLDSEGYLKALELHQDGQSITITLSTGGTHYAGYRWEEVRAVIDNLQTKAQKDLNDSIMSSNSFANLKKEVS